MAFLPAKASGSKLSSASRRPRKDGEASDATAKLLYIFPWLSPGLVEAALEEAEEEEARQ